MGKIEQLVKSKLLGNDNPNNLVWPITKTRAVYDKTNTDLQTVLDSLDSEIQEIKEINNVSVRYDQVQELTEEQKETARANIDAGTYSKPEGGIPASDLADDVIPETPFIPGTGEGSATLKPTMIWETGGATKPPLSVTGDANATTYQYNCAYYEPQEFWPVGLKISVDEGIHEATIVSVDGDSNGTLTVSSTLSETAVENKEVTFYKDLSSVASGEFAVAEGKRNTASGSCSHAEGIRNTASGVYSHVEGAENNASGQYSHAEGVNSFAEGRAAHAEGIGYAQGAYSHSEGDTTRAAGMASHAEGQGTIASGAYSHTSGSYTETKNTAEFALGEYNKSNTGTVVTRFSIGNGTISGRKNVVEILADGRVFIQDVGEYDGTNPTRATDLATLMSNVVVKRFSTDQQIGFKYPLDENQQYKGLPYIALVREMSSGKIALVSYGGEDDSNATKVYDPDGICEKFVDSDVASWSALRFVNNHLTVEVAFLSAYKGQTVEGIPWGFPYTDLSDKIIRFEETSNKVTTLSAQSTDLQYPSAKAVWDMVSSKYTKPSEGIPASDLTQTAQTSLGKADAALQGVVLDWGQDGFYDISDIASAQTKQRKEPIILKGAGLKDYLEGQGFQDYNEIDHLLVTNILYVQEEDVYYEIDAIGQSNGKTVALKIILERSGDEEYSWSLRPTLQVLESKSNKVTSLTAQSTNTQYPSAKCVYDALATKQPIIDSSHKLDYALLSNTPTIPTVPQISTNITTDASSNTKTASPKAVKDYVDANGMKVVTYGSSVSEIPSAPLCYVPRSDVLDIIPNAGGADDQITSEPGVYLTRQDYSDAEPEENVRYSGIYSYYTFESSASVHRTCVVTALYNAGDWELEVHDLYDEIHPAVASSQPSGGFVPNVMYNLGTLSGNTTFALATPADANIVNHYYWTFDTSSTAPTITWPSGLSWFGGSAPTVNASKHYEISVLNGIGIFMEV